jgi:hypothetical protein
LRFGFRYEKRELQRNPTIVVGYMRGSREAERRDDPAMNAVVPLLVASELSCEKRPAGVENDWANVVGEPWLA